MVAKFYHCTVDDRYVYKLLSSDQTNTDLAYVEVLEPTDIIRPKIKVSTGRLGRYTNYVWIKELDRFYYIRNIVMENGYSIIECEEDVRMTFRTGLAKKAAMIARIETMKNVYLKDDNIKLLAPTATKVLKDGWSSPFDDDSSYFYLAVVSSQGAEGGE